MILHLDESYDQDKKYLLLGVLFCPQKTAKILLEKITKLKEEEKFFVLSRKRKVYKEIKYSKLRGHKMIRIAKKLIDFFMESNAFFKAIVIKKNDLHLENFGDNKEHKNMKEARVYKKFTEILISKHLKNIKHGSLFADELLHCKGDRFCEFMKQAFTSPKYFHGLSVPTLQTIRKVSSSAKSSQLIQICDLLLGCITHDLNKTKDKEKNKIRNYLCEKLDKPNLLSENWKEDDEYRNYAIWYWKPKIYTKKT